MFMDNRQFMHTQNLQPPFYTCLLYTFFLNLFLLSVFTTPSCIHIIFGLMPFGGWLCTFMLPRFYKTHYVEQDWEAVCLLEQCRSIKLSFNWD